MFKFVIATLLFALVVSAQVSRHREGTSEDPIGNFRARIRGWVAQDKPEVDFVGFAERLEDPQTKTMMCHTAIELLPKGTASNINANKKLNGPFMQTFSFQREDSIDFFLNVGKNLKDVGQCFYAFVGQKANLRLGQWESLQNKCGKQRTGTLYVRRANFTDSNGDEIVQAEAFCKTQEKVLWFEISTLINNEPQYVLHADVIQESQKPEAQMPDLLSFSIPAICVLKPQVVTDQMDLSHRILQALGVTSERSGSSSSRSGSSRSSRSSQGSQGSQDSRTDRSSSRSNANVPEENANLPEENTNLPEENTRSNARSSIENRLGSRIRNSRSSTSRASPGENIRESNQ